MEAHTKKSKKKGGPKEKCVPIAEREKRVQYLRKKESHTNTAFFYATKMPDTASLQHSQAEARELVAAMIAAQNKPWAERKKQPQYSIPRNYFGQCT